MGSKFSDNNSSSQSWGFNEYSYYFQYHTIFFRPRLRLEFDIYERTTFTPHLRTDNTEFRFLKLRVRNTGHRTLHNCMAQIHVIIPRSKNVNRMGFPSDEYKQLAWNRSTNLNDLSETTDIQGHNFSLVHVVFSDRRFNGRIACVSTFGDIRSSNHRTEDTFVPGQYVAEVLITTDEGPYLKTFFDINVDQNWELLTMSRMSWIRNYYWKTRTRYYF
jgi:hypothetical protein